MAEPAPLDLAARLEATPPGSPERKTAALLLALLEATRGDRAAARPLLEAIRRDRAYPDYMADLAGHFLARYPEYAGAPLVLEHAAFDDLVCASVDRFAPDEVGAELAELLQRRFAKSPSDPLAPLFALLALSHAASSDEPSLVAERSEAIRRHYPGSKYEARARMCEIRQLRLALSADAKRLAEERGKLVPEAWQARRDALRRDATRLAEAVEECLKRFAHLPLARADLALVADALERLDAPDLMLRFLKNQAERLAAHPEGAELHLRFVMHHARHAPAEETYSLAREHLDRYPGSRHRAWMELLRGQYLTARDDAAAFPILAGVVTGGHPTWADQAEEEALAWVRARRGTRDPEWLLPRIEPLAAFPFSGERQAEFLYLRAETLKEAAIRWGPERRLPALDRVVILAQELRERYPESRFANLAGATAEEIRRGDIERSIAINRLSNRLIAAFSLSYLAFYLYSATLYPEIWSNWIFVIQTIMILLVAALYAVLKYGLGMF